MEHNSLITPAVLSVTDAARYLGIARETLFRLMAKSDITYVQMSPGRRGFRPADLDAYLAKRVVHARKSGAA